MIDAQTQKNMKVKQKIKYRPNIYRQIDNLDLVCRKYRIT